MTERICVAPVASTYIVHSR